jgi:protein-disulfide isomerase
VVSDFQCPYCKLYHDSTGPKIQREYVETGKIRLAYLNYPLSQHQHAVPAAEAAMCAGAQGKFWAFHDSLFASQREWAGLGDATPVFHRIAQGTAVDQAAFTECLNGHVMRAMIGADYERGRAQGVPGTPTFFVGTRRVDNTYAYSLLKPILDSAIAAAARGGDRGDR